MERLRRMFDEAMTEGYIARSQKQMHDIDGGWGSYIYIVGADPTLVADEATRLGVPVLPQPGNPCTAQPRVAHQLPYKRKKDNHELNLKTERSEAQYGDCAIAAQAAGNQGSEDYSLQGTTKCERPEVIQSRIARRLGPDGWAILMKLPASELDQLTARERTGNLDHTALEQVRLNAAIG
jgi:hypothetical protein